ncbi:metal-dependent transcriptional regulator [Lachnoclostridium sp. MSJ-17]|uniref:metal-dependent transcriptional regulator n=1 Tax=Lachnoclostridium sp. MSJ-17 TaxID=2841516 RepID=UPI001C110DD8|nr:metal-dependent transcriptional regulator [Lachnoclostridium sp. MSJ-17]MBU5461331.1 metal-dependent transcriptional regulator [Lachnoclostridium sp. MSJ-17]
MVLKESGEMYLETIYVLRKDKGFVRAIDVGAELGYSKPSVSRAMGILRDGGYIKVAQDGGITLTEAGLEVAERTYDRHTVLSKLFMKLGVDEENAVNDACKIEHVISSTTFAALKKHLNEDL